MNRRFSLFFSVYNRVYNTTLAVAAAYNLHVSRLDGRCTGCV